MARFVEDSAAIFSPSVARVAASTARDWSHVEAWLASKLPNQPLPPFERNAATLKALLALSIANEQADEEADLLLQSETSALANLTNPTRSKDEGYPSDPGALSHAGVRDALLSAVEDELPNEAQTELESVAALALELGVAHPEPEMLGDMILKTQTDLCEMEQMRTRVETFQRHIEHAQGSNEASLQYLEGPALQTPEDLPKRNLDLQRSLRAAPPQHSEPRDHLGNGAGSNDISHPTIQDMVAQEGLYLNLLWQKKDLDAQLASFQGLPTETSQARAELDALRRQLRGITSRRDEVFEGLVERESPVKRR